MLSATSKGVGGKMHLTICKLAVGQCVFLGWQGEAAHLWL
jgi:hypothetical protein